MIDGRALNGQGPFAPQGLKQVQPNAYICILLAGVKTNHIAFAEQGCQIASYPCIPETIRSNQHVGQPWMHRQSGHLAALIGNPAIKTQGTEGPEKAAGAVKRVPGRRIKPFQFAWIVHTPKSQLQNQAGQVGLQNFRPVRRDQRVVHFPGPQAQADSRSDPSGPPPPLVGRSPRHRDGDQPG